MGRFLDLTKKGLLLLAYQCVVEMDYLTNSTQNTSDARHIKFDEAAVSNSTLAQPRFSSSPKLTRNNFTMVTRACRWTPNGSWRFRIQGKKISRVCMLASGLYMSSMFIFPGKDQDFEFGLPLGRPESLSLDCKSQKGITCSSHFECAFQLIEELLAVWKVREVGLFYYDHPLKHQITTFRCCCLIN